MTMPMTRMAFDRKSAHPMPAFYKDRPRECSRISAILVTLAAHAAVVAVLLAGFHSARILPPPVFTVHLETEKSKPSLDLPLPPGMARPNMITAPVPEITIRTEPSPILAQPPAAEPKATPAPAAAPTTLHPIGASREEFLARLLAQLNRAKRYPREARQAHLEGVVMLHFVLNADGTVASFEIAKSSGRPLLDKEALALIQRAQPLPALPADFPTRSLDAIVPIAFSLEDQ